MKKTLLPKENFFDSTLPPEPLNCPDSTKSMDRRNKRKYHEADGDDHQCGDITHVFFHKVLDLLKAILKKKKAYESTTCGNSPCIPVGVLSSTSFLTGFFIIPTSTEAASRPSPSFTGLWISKLFLSKEREQEWDFLQSLILLSTSLTSRDNCSNSANPLQFNPLVNCWGLYCEWECERVILDLTFVHKSALVSLL